MKTSLERGRGWKKAKTIRVSTFRRRESQIQREEGLGVQVLQAQGPRFDPSNVRLWA